MESNKRSGSRVEAKEHKKSTKESPLVVVEKNLRVPASEAFQAWVKPELIKEWWGPDQFSCPLAEVDFRVGGRYVFGMEGAGQTMYSAGEYLEIQPNKKIVYTDAFSDSAGRELSKAELADGPFADFEKTFVTVEFDDRGDGACKMTISHEGIPGRMHDDCVDGWSSSLDKFKTVVERH